MILENGVNWNEVRNDLLDDWIWLKLHDISVTDYCKSNKLNRVVIYGAGELGMLVYKDMFSTGIQAVAYLDQKGAYHDYKCFDIPVFAPDDDRKITDSIDLIILATLASHDEIKGVLREYYLCEIISIRDIIDDLLKEIQQ